MAEAKVERVVVNKAIFITDPDTGARRQAPIGETVFLAARTAKVFEMYLENPKVAKAIAAVQRVEEKAEAEEAKAAEAPTQGEGDEG